jgi:Clostridial hydrophobic W
MDVKFERLSAIAVSRGLLVVRYASSGAEKDFPLAVVRPGAECEKLVEIISAPGVTQGYLERPGDSLVVRVHDAARLEVGVRRTAPEGSLDASFQIDSLSGGKLPSAIPSNAKTVAEPIKSAMLRDFAELRARDSERSQEAKPAKPVKPALAFVAHVAMRGDVEAREDQWIAGPNAPAPIEGLAIKSENPSRLGVEIQALIAGAQQWTGWASSGAYTGTKGRGLPLLGLRLRLSGAEAARMEFSAEGLFLGSTSVAKSGRQIEFVSATGSDPLVGLKLGVRTIERSPSALTSEGPWRDRGSRVRVFRSSSGA